MIIFFTDICKISTIIKGLELKKTPKTEILEYLDQCKEISSKSFELVRRRENKETIIDLGFTHVQVVEIIQSLSLDDYCDGPLPDRTFKGYVWVFGKMINNREVYIKLKFSEYNDPGELIPTVYCLSFHYAKRSLIYPYKKNKEKSDE